MIMVFPSGLPRHLAQFLQHASARRDAEMHHLVVYISILSETTAAASLRLRASHLVQLSVRSMVMFRLPRSPRDYFGHSYPRIHPFPIAISTRGSRPNLGEASPNPDAWPRPKRRHAYAIVRIWPNPKSPPGPTHPLIPTMSLPLHEAPHTPP
ncbi:hypothetical protein BJV74DRAFT_494431 [Russula compacta]|nr:hypothetical protein BJV74DRAFT_494431 [Russula compacta]